MNNLGTLLTVSILMLVSLVLLQTTASAGTYYVDAKNGNDHWNGQFDTHKGANNGPWKTIAKANSSVGPADTVNIRQGAYSESIEPAKSGKAEQLITYKAYNNETVTFTGDSVTPINLVKKDYVKVSGITVENVDRFIYMEDSAHNTIENCKFTNSRQYACSYILNSRYNRFLNNHFTCDGDFGGADLIKLVSNWEGWLPKRDQGQYGSDYNLIEGNYFGDAKHAALTIRGRYNIARKNILNNPLEKNVDISWQEKLKPWGGSGDGVFNVFEYNISKNAGPTFEYSGIMHCADHCIIRFNEFYGSFGDGVELSIWDGTASGGDKAPYCNNNRIYHNVIYDHNDFTKHSRRDRQKWNNGIGITPNLDYNQIFNNILWKNHEPQMENRYNATTYVGQYQWDKDLKDPAYVPPYNPCFVDEAGFDFHLKPDSPYIDKGEPIAKVSGSGTGKVVTIATKPNSKYSDCYSFTDGFGVVDGDKIWLNKKEAVIVDIDYDKGTITLDRKLTFNDGDQITFPYSGKAPDIGMYEYTPK